ncbi:hypothetical protein H310_01428 [Aphanomyces invadans]|uniref:UV excision repair protein RAD23 n=1 Tax=Aphanomyces invadans TaxID=157072 RepID=A0A024USS0_9STRA|nr:hypothetical protein H310_01428 [Aphanomyces invadans]ETW08947.1 hypothetical protein H310_01428 [Aphanomyces invadans]|eukprot:XP_008862752.1 hypothetical protein H310_01428 [Aphanomyces invadans]
MTVSIRVVVLGYAPPAAPTKASGKRKKRPLERTHSSRINVEFQLRTELEWSVLQLKEAIANQLERELDGAANGVQPENQCIAVNGVLVCDADSLGTILFDSRTLVCAIDKSEPSPSNTPVQSTHVSGALNQLRSMGFSTKRASEALVVAKNNVEGAVAFLTEGIQVDTSSHEETDTHLADVAMTKPYSLVGAIQSCNPDHLVDLSLDRLTAAMRRRQERECNGSHVEDGMEVDEETKDDDAVIAIYDDERDAVHDASQLADVDAEQIALDRLQALGFSRHDAYNAYVACDRNENAAANFLFESM